MLENVVCTQHPSETQRRRAGFEGRARTLITTISCALMTLKPWRSVAEATIGVRRPRGEMAEAVALTVVIGHHIPNQHALARARLVVHAFGTNPAL